MNLRAFLDGLPRGGITSFATDLGISPIYLSQLATGQGGREPSPELCVLIEVKSHLDVRRWDLRPTDWWLIWPELIGAAGAPAIPQAEEQPQG